jgi:hypothetical protein
MAQSNYLVVVEYDNFIEIDSKRIADVDDYDHYISVLNSSYNMFNNDFLKVFKTQNAVGFFGLNDVIPVDLPIGLFKKQLSSVRSANTVNLEFYTNTFKNMFLRMDVNGDEVEWFNYISEDKLKNFKQILIAMDPAINETALKKLSNDHVIVNIEIKDGKHIITYLRKDALTNYTPTRKINKFVKLPGPPWRKLEEVVDEQAPLVEEAPVIAEPVPVVEKTPVIEEPVPVVEEAPVIAEPVPVVEEAPVVEEPVPVVEEAPVIEEPLPVVEEPLPVVEEPLPVVEEAPVVEEPLPVVEEVPVVEEAPVIAEPVPVVEEPVPVVEEALVVEEPVPVVEEAPVVEEPLIDKVENFEDPLVKNNLQPKKLKKDRWPPQKN